MGIPPYLVASSMTVCLAQRLVRKICSKCITDYYAPKEVLKELGVDEDKNIKLSRGRGCPECYDSGFKDRTGIYELLEIDQNLQSLILKNPSIDTIKSYLTKNDHKTLEEAGYKKVMEGITTLEEVKRVSYVDM